MIVVHNKQRFFCTSLRHLKCISKKPLFTHVPFIENKDLL